MRWNHPQKPVNPFLIALAWQSAMFNLIMTAPRKTKQTAEIVSITAKADKLRVNRRDV